MMKVPFLSDAKIDSAASELLGKYAKGSGGSLRGPIPIDDIIEKFLRVTLEVTDLRSKLGSDVLGAAYFEENIIRVDETLLDQEGRLSFTMGHEVGHWQLHRPVYEMDKVSGSLFGPKPELPSFVCRSSAKPPAEIQADKFAARLLMPERLVREAFRAVRGEGAYLIAGLRDRRADSSVVAPWAEVAKAVMDQGAFTNVSVEAMRYRLDGLGLVRDAESARAQPKLF
jgi:Zn-dependent peptidase ImmA (M78 family)